MTQAATYTICRYAHKPLSFRATRGIFLPLYANESKENRASSEIFRYGGLPPHYVSNMTGDLIPPDKMDLGL
jgi:hypothetical protein